MAYFSGQGDIYLSDITEDGKPSNLMYVGNTPAFSISLETSVVEHQESSTGQRGIDARLITAKSGTVNIDLEDFNLDNLAVALHGEKIKKTKGTVTKANIELTPQQLRLLENSNIDIDSVHLYGSDDLEIPKEKYRIKDTGSIILFSKLDAKYKSPYKISYSYDDSNFVAMFKSAAPIKYLRFEGVNTAYANKEMAVDVYKVEFSPTTDLGFISNEYQSLKLVGSLLQDKNKPADGELGQYGRIII